MQFVIKEVKDFSNHRKGDYYHELVIDLLLTCKNLEGKYLSRYANCTTTIINIRRIVVMSSRNRVSAFNKTKQCWRKDTKAV